MTSNLQVTQVEQPEAFEIPTTPAQLPMVVCFAVNPNLHTTEDNHHDQDSEIVIAEFTAIQPFHTLLQPFPESKRTMQFSNNNLRLKELHLIQSIGHVLSRGYREGVNFLERLTILDQSLDTLYISKREDVMLEALSSSAEPRQSDLYSQLQDYFVTQRLKRINKYDERISKLRPTEDEQIANLALEILNIAWEYNIPYNHVVELYKGEPCKRHKWFTNMKFVDFRLNRILEAVDLEAKKFAEFTTMQVVRDLKGVELLKVTLPAIDSNDPLLQMLHLWDQPFYDDRLIKLISRYLVTKDHNQKGTVYRLIYALQNPTSKPEFMKRKESPKVADAKR